MQMGIDHISVDDLSKACLVCATGVVPSSTVPGFYVENNPPLSATILAVRKNIQ